MKARIYNTISLCMLLGFITASPAYCASPTATNPNALSPATTGSIAILSPGAPVSFNAAQLAELPQIKLNLLFGGHQGLVQTAFQGPLLWTILTQANAINVNKPKPLVSQYVTVTGADGYVAVIAVGEIAPQFEGKQVILALQMNGRTLGAGHARIVIPGDTRAARSVYDVVRISVVSVK